MNSKPATDAVSDLLQVLEDGKEGFHRSAEAVSDPNLTALFSAYSSHRALMAEELLTSADREERKPTLAGAMHRGWIDLKAALMPGELPDDVCQLIKSQSVRILEAHNRVRELRDAATASS